MVFSSGSSISIIFFELIFKAISEEFYCQNVYPSEVINPQSFFEALLAEGLLS
jgi:hypothetical protein